METKKIGYLVVAIVLIGIGGYRESGGRVASSADQARCEQNVRDQYGDSRQTNDLLVKCTDPGMVAMMDAKISGADAQTAAQNIAGANSKDIVSTVINFAMIGGGIGALATAFGIRRRKRD